MTRKFHIHLFLLCLIAVVIGCGKKPAKENPNPQNENLPTVIKDGPIKNTNNKNNPKDSTLTVGLIKSIDTNKIRIDTLVWFGNYELAITHEKFDSNKKRLSLDDMYFNPITIYVIKKETDTVVYKKSFEENQFVTTFSFQNNTDNYISLSTFGGGSGFVSTMYKFEFEKSIEFKKVFTYGELTYFSFNRDGSEILSLGGIWDLFAEGNEGEINETHFADHAYEVTTIDLSGKEPKTILHGTTKYKYPSEDSGTTVFELFHLIQKKEPATCKNISLDKYPTE